MLSRFLAVAASVCLGGFICVQEVFAQDAVKEPEYANQYFALLDGKLQPLERQDMKMEAKLKKRFVYTKGTTAEFVDGAASSVAVPPHAHFVVRMDVGDIDPSTLIFLKTFKVEKGERQIVITSHTANIVTGPQSTSKVGDDTTVAVTVKRYGTKSFEIMPSQPLPAGEYVFVPTASGLGASTVYCFRVGG